jgi:hypothetical protein
VTWAVRSFRAKIVYLHLEGDGIQQLAESSPLAVKLITADRGSLGTQFVDHHLATDPHVHRVDDAAQGPTRILPTSSRLEVVEETVFSSVAQSRYAIGVATHEILLLITTPLKSRYVRLAQLHLRIAATLLAMRAAHPTYEVSGIVKTWGRTTSGVTSPLTIGEGASRDRQQHGKEKC